MFVKTQFMQEKKMFGKVTKFWSSVSLIAVLLCAQISVFAFDTVWTFKGAKWYSLLESGNIMAGNDSTVNMLDGNTGKVIWTRNNLGKIQESEFTELEGTPLVLISDNSGWAQRKTKLTAIDSLTGETVWETEKMLGFTVNISPLYEKDMLIFLTIKDNRQNKDKPDIFALKMSTGELLWQTEYPEKVDLYGVEKRKNSGAKAMFLGSGGGRSDRFDLSGENPPIFDGNSMFMTYAGIHRYNLSDGKLVWKTLYDVTDGSLKNTNGQAIIDGDTIFTSANGIIRAIDKSTGAEKWKTKDFGKGGIAEMQLLDGVIYGRLGGQFFSAKKGEWLEKGPVGVVALNKANGETNWLYKDADESITNMLVIPSENILLIADKKNLIGLDLTSKGKVKEAYKIKLKFKRSLGAGDVAGKATAIAFGGIGGAFKKGAKRTDNPVSLVRQENGTVVVRGKQHLLAFNPTTKEIAWSTKYAAPGISGWQTIVMTALTVTAAAMSQSLEANHMRNGNYNSAFDENQRFLNLISNYQKFIGTKYSDSNQAGNIYYVLTNIKGGDDSGSGLIGVNMLTGEGERQIVFNDKSPDYEVDEHTGRLFNLNKDTLTAFTISDRTETKENTDEDN
ncbi:MAG: PQQ-binding-like beta-propeller repeat protein [Pyrinomonadaceae bacterium]